MDKLERRKRLRGLIHGINRDRKKQAKQIDILCNDMVAAHREFVKRLDAISFTSSFYESLACRGDLGGVLNISGEIIKNEIGESGLSFFLRQQEGFEVHAIESAWKENSEIVLEGCFDDELVESICEANRLCRLEKLFEIGLAANPAVLKSIDAVTIPLGEGGVSVGFILIYRPVEKKFTDEQLERVISITPGLTGAIKSCQISVDVRD